MPIDFIEFFIALNFSYSPGSGRAGRGVVRFSTPRLNAPSKADVPGIWARSVLSGYKHYTHVMAMRCYGVNTGLLGMSKVISERTPCAMPSSVSRERLDTDTPIKPFYGKQEVTIASCNSKKKPRRPSHGYHTYLVVEPHL